MKTDYIFLTENYKEGPTTYYAIYPDRIEELNISDTYGNYGQIIGHDYAGNTIELLTQKAVDKANEQENDYKIGTTIFAYEDYDAFRNVIMNTEEVLDYKLEAETCKGFNFWNGHNWQTVIISPDHFNNSHTVVEDEELIVKLNKAIDDSEFKHEGFGEKIYEGNGYIVIDNYCQGSWDSYRLMKIEDYENSRRNN